MLFPLTILLCGCALCYLCQWEDEIPVREFIKDLKENLSENWSKITFLIMLILYTILLLSVNVMTFFYQGGFYYKNYLQ